MPIHVYIKSVPLWASGIIKLLPQTLMWHYLFITWAAAGTTDSFIWEGLRIYLPGREECFQLEEEEEVWEGVNETNGRGYKGLGTCKQRVLCSDLKRVSVEFRKIEIALQEEKN